MIVPPVKCIYAFTIVAQIRDFVNGFSKKDERYRRILQTGHQDVLPLRYQFKFFNFESSISLRGLRSIYFQIS